MNINRIQNYNYNIYIRTNSACKQKAETNKLCRDEFINSNSEKNVTFSGLQALYKPTLRNIIRTRALQTSMENSRVLYLNLEDDLARITKPIKIRINKSEVINAYDINPKNSNKYVIYLHGFSQNITHNQPLYKALSQTDYGILAIDYRGYGENIPSKHYFEKNIIEDILAAKKYLSEKNIKQIGLIGHSFGAYLASKSSKSHDFAFQILISPMLSLNFWAENVLKHPKKHKLENYIIRHLPIIKNQYKHIFTMQKYTENNNTPTCLIHSNNDTYIRIDDVKALSKKIPHMIQSSYVDNGGHRMENSKIEEIVKTVNNL